MPCCTTCGPAAYAAGRPGAPLGHPDNSPYGLQQFPLEGHEGRHVCEQWDWKHLDVNADRSYGILQDGSLWGWGKAPLGDGTLEDSECPVHIHSGPWATAKGGYAIKEDGSLWLISGQTGLEPAGVLQNAGAIAYLSSQVASVSVTRGGNYSVPPIARAQISAQLQSLNHSVGTQAALKSVISISFVDIVVTNGGGGYSTPPDVWLENNRGDKVQCDAVIKNGAIVGVIERSQQRFEYAFGEDREDIVPRVYFSYGGAQATAALSEGPVIRAEVVSGGEAYTTVPSVVFERDEDDTANPYAVGWPTSTEAVAVASLAPSVVDKIELHPEVYYNRNQYPAAKVGRIVDWYDHIPTWSGSLQEGTASSYFFSDIPFKAGVSDVDIELTGDGSGAAVVAEKTVNGEGGGAAFFSNFITGQFSGRIDSYSLGLAGDDGGFGWRFPPHPILHFTEWKTALTFSVGGAAVVGSSITSEEKSFFLPALEIDGPPSEWVHTPSVLIDSDTSATAIMATAEDGGRYVSKIVVDKSQPAYTTNPQVKISHYTLYPRPLSDFCQEFNGKRWKDVGAHRNTASTGWTDIFQGCDADGGYAIEEGTGHIWHWGAPAKANSGSVYPHPFGGLVAAIDSSDNNRVPPPPLGMSRHAGLLTRNRNNGQLVVVTNTTVLDYRAPHADPQACGYLEPANNDEGLLFAEPISFDRFCGPNGLGSQYGFGAITAAGRLYFIAAGRGIYCGPANGGKLGETVDILDGGQGYPWTYGPGWAGGNGTPTAEPVINVPCLIKPYIPDRNMSVSDDGQGRITYVRLVYGYGFPDDEDITITFRGRFGGGGGAVGLVRNIEAPLFDVVVSNANFYWDWPCRGLDGKWYTQKLLNPWGAPVFGTATERRNDIDESLADVVSAFDTVCRRADGRLTSAAPVDAPQYRIGSIEATVTDSGSGYTLPATPSLPAQHPGIPSASVKPNPMTGKVYAVCVLNGGSGYEEAPSVEIEGNAEVACAILGPVVEVIVTHGGTGYLTPPDVTFSGVGIPARGRSVLDGSGSVTSVVVEYGGEYRAAPVVFFSGGNGSGATAVCRINGSIVYADVVESGSDYTHTPAVTVSGNARLAARILLDYESPGFETNPPVKLWPGVGPNSRQRLPSTIAYVGQSRLPAGSSPSQDSGVCFHADATRNSDGSYDTSIFGVKQPESIKFYSHPSVVLGGNTFLVPTTELAVAGVAFSRTWKNEFFPQSKGRDLSRSSAVSNGRSRQSALGFHWGSYSMEGRPADAGISLDFVMRGKFVNEDGSPFDHAQALQQLTFYSQELRGKVFTTPPTARIVDHVGSGVTATGVLDVDGRLASWSADNPPTQQDFTSKCRWEFTVPQCRSYAKLATATATLDGMGSIYAINVSDGGEYQEVPDVVIEGDGSGAVARAVTAQAIIWIYPPPPYTEGFLIIGGSPVVDANIEYPLNIVSGGLYKSTPRVFAYGGGRATELRVALGGPSVASVELISKGSGYTTASVSILPPMRPKTAFSLPVIGSYGLYRNFIQTNWGIEYVQFYKPDSPIWRSIASPDSVACPGKISEWSEQCLFVFYESGHVSEVRILNDSAGVPVYRARWDQFPPPAQAVQLAGDATRGAVVTISRPVWSECYSEKELGGDFACVAAKRSDGV